MNGLSKNVLIGVMAAAALATSLSFGYNSYDKYNTEQITEKARIERVEKLEKTARSIKNAKVEIQKMAEKKGLNPLQVRILERAAQLDSKFSTNKDLNSSDSEIQKSATDYVNSVHHRNLIIKMSTHPEMAATIKAMASLSDNTADIESLALTVIQAKVHDEAAAVKAEAEAEKNGPGISGCLAAKQEAHNQGMVFGATCG